MSEDTNEINNQVEETVNEIVEENKKKEKEPFNLKKEILEWIYAIAVAMIVALLIRYFLFTPTMVKQTSMYPTLKENERLFLSRIIRVTNGMPERGDIITFEAPYAIGESNANPKAIYNDETAVEGFIKDFFEIGKICYIKRVIGLPGDKIEIKDGKVYVNGEEYIEPYITEGVETYATNFHDLTVPEGTIFVMGDNRTGSKDSREFGCIPMDKIEGKVKFRMWPLDVFGKIE
ncbi:MAG: signal peptidase I [Clostridiales bacterium]|nr:signal peptidase I [Clostridiales bacterium]